MGDNFSALYIQIIGRFVQDKHIRGIVTNHQATESEAHLLSAAKFPARLVPFGSREKIAVQDNLDFMFRQVTGIECVSLFRYRIPVVDNRIFLIEIH